MVSPKTWSTAAVMRLMLALFISLFAGFSLMHLLAWQTPDWTPDDQRFANLVIATVTIHITFLLLVGLFLREEGLTWREAFGFSNPRLARGIFLAFLTTILLLPVTFFLTRLSAEVMTQFGRDPHPQDAVEALRHGSGHLQKAYLGLVAMVLAPCAEEILFRGIIYPTIKQQGFPRLALLGTSLLFAAIHGNLMTMVPLTLLAMVLAGLYELTDNLLVPILTHSLFNMFNFVYLLNDTPQPGSLGGFG